MIKLLSLETATDHGSYCLWCGDVDSAAADVHTVTCPPEQPHAETLLPLLRQSLAKRGWSVQDLDAVAYDAGPGMFTGLRVPAALAQGLAFASGKPVIGVCSLEALAESAFERVSVQRVLTLLDARMNQIYAAAWERKVDGTWNPLLASCLVDPGAMDALVAATGVCSFDAVAGTALNEYPEVVAWCDGRKLRDSQVRSPDAAAVAVLGARRFARGDVQDPAEAIPVYVRDRVALTSAERAAGLVL